MAAHVLHDADHEGKMLAGTAIVRDITAGRAAAEALRASEEQLRMILEKGRVRDLLHQPRAQDHTHRAAARPCNQHVRKDGSTFRGTGTMMVMCDAAGEPGGFVKKLRAAERRPAS